VGASGIAALVELIIPIAAMLAMINKTVNEMLTILLLILFLSFLSCGALQYVKKTVITIMEINTIRKFFSVLREFCWLFGRFWQDLSSKLSQLNGEGPLLSHKLDKVDLRIMHSLAQDARKAITQLSVDAGISRPTAINRLKKLRENGILSVHATVNITKLGFKLALVTFRTKSNNAGQEPRTGLAVCPRVLLLVQKSGDRDCSALLYSENTETLLSVVECVKSVSGVELTSWHRLSPPLLPEAFELKLFPHKGKLTPCGKKCGVCSNYQNQECLGCPAVVEYKGPF